MCLKSEQDLWCLDSGCSRHMSLFSEIKRKGHGSITFGDKGSSKIIGIGKIGKDPSNFVDKVYFVDGFKFNLFSISQPHDKGKT